MSGMDDEARGKKQDAKNRNEQIRTSPSEARKKQSWWPGWIWAVPIAALGIGAWLLVRHLTQGGTDITITFQNIYGIDPADTNVMYLGMKVGKVTGVSLRKDGNAVKVSANIDDSASKFLRTGTVFWLRGTNVSLSNLSSLGSILSGPTFVMQPGPGRQTKKFIGFAHEPLPSNRGQPVLFTVSFEGAVGDVSEGDFVKVRGFTVGEVKQIGFHYDVKSGQITTPVTLALYPALFHFENEPLPDGADALRAALSYLIEQGLRARLGREPALIGGYEISLDMIPGAPHATLKIVDSMPEIPTAPSGGLEMLVNRAKNIPLDQIGQNLLAITKHLDETVSTGHLKDAVVQLDASLQEIHGLLTDVSPKVDKLVQDLRGTATELDQTAQAADRMLGGAPAQTGLNDTLREVKEAARSLRSLADYLDRHPEALLKGRSGD
jgi:paraquat-inducible protein B